MLCLCLCICGCMLMLYFGKGLRGLRYSVPLSRLRINYPSIYYMSIFPSPLLAMRRICIYLSIYRPSFASRIQGTSGIKLPLTLNPRRAALPSEPLVTPQLISPPTNQPTNFSGCSLLLSLTAHAHSPQLNRSSSADVSSSANLSPRKEKKRKEKR